jgi:hypothetical protein
MDPQTATGAIDLALSVVYSVGLLALVGLSYLWIWRRNTPG